MWIEPRGTEPLFPPHRQVANVQQWADTLPGLACVMPPSHASDPEKLRHMEVFESWCYIQASHLASRPLMPPLAWSLSLALVGETVKEHGWRGFLWFVSMTQADWEELLEVKHDEDEGGEDVQETTSDPTKNSCKDILCEAFSCFIMLLLSMTFLFFMSCYVANTVLAVDQDMADDTCSYASLMPDFVAPYFFPADCFTAASTRAINTTNTTANTSCTLCWQASLLMLKYT
jgi:hypothetical protein